MIIIIDAYNFMKQVLGKTFISEKEMTNWIASFKRYTQLRNNQILLVFDAGPYEQRFDEHFGHVTVMYSGQKKSADHVMQDWLSKNRDVDVLVVTSDREIRDFASNINIVSVGSQDFYRIFTQVMQREISYEQKIMHTLHKTTTESILGLDELMEKSSRFLGQNTVCREDIGLIRIRDGKKVSKQDRRILKKLEKI